MYAFIGCGKITKACDFRVANPYSHINIILYFI
nr:MAG TPA: hypothetical protein [Caudoviricetes sp.]DAI90944.1 MAG TPA: hypothetical protein [Caudoviricetes sp.]DAS89924.1 MAG TPA: hypothetical protein [Caudoviricetes sp.]DAY17394.1 MAG TPA: hypothetical protein [Caudoviricetes sp.]DAZ83763.1 MAG TPA: hypothetical protein [Caudoviricetes sp.]